MQKRYDGQFRKDGVTPYIIHPLQMACYAVALGYHTSSVTLANRMRLFFGRSLKEIRPVKNSGQFKPKEISQESFYQDIKSNIMTNKEICEKYNIGETTLYNKCKRFFGKTPNQIRKG